MKLCVILVLLLGAIIIGERTTRNRRPTTSSPVTPGEAAAADDDDDAGGNIHVHTAVTPRGLALPIWSWVGFRNVRTFVKMKRHNLRAVSAAADGAAASESGTGYHHRVENRVKLNIMKIRLSDGSGAGRFLERKGEQVEMWAIWVDARA